MGRKHKSCAPGEKKTNLYALKREASVKFKPPQRGYSINEQLNKFYEAKVTPTCLDFCEIGRDRYMLLELGEKVDFAKLSIVDVVNVFKDMESLQNYARKYLKTHITQEVCLYHADIHSGNMMRFKGQLRLIDFGVSRLFPTAAMESKI